jgi:hypothetical protein
MLDCNADSHKNFPQDPFKKLNILPLIICMVHDYSFFGSTADFVIKKEYDRRIQRFLKFTVM